jgi:protein O-mannosyl-transferase
LPPDSATDRDLWPWLALGGVGAVALAASIAGLPNELVQDDVGLILQNTRIHHLSNWREVVTSPYWPTAWNPELYRPVTSLLHSAEYELGGARPAVFRVVSYLLYAGAALAFYLLSARLLPKYIGLGVALLFAAHPVHVEAVALGVGQSELVVALCAMLMTSRYLVVRRRGFPGAGDWALLAVLYVLASLTKEQGMLLPALLVAGEVFLLPGPALLRVRRLWRGYGFLALAALGLILWRRSILDGQFAGVAVAEALEGLGLGGRAMMLLRVAPEWARLLLWPADLQADYSPQEIVAPGFFGLTEALGLVLVAGVVAAIWWGRRGVPVLSFGLAWTAVALFPVSNLLVPTGIVLAERTLFLPSAGMLIALGGLVAHVWPRLVGSSGIRRALAVACGLLVVAGIARSAERHGVWRNERVLSARGARDAPRSYRAQLAEGYQLFESGDRERGLETYRLALSLAPPRHAWRIRNDLARRFFGAGEYGPAVEQLLVSLGEAPERLETWNYLILGYLGLGNYPEAARLAGEALNRGAPAEPFAGLGRLADSAFRVQAPPGSIRVRVVPGPPPTIR